MTRYIEVVDGVAMNELFTNGVPAPPSDRIMLDVTDRPDIVLGSVISFRKPPTGSVFAPDAAVLVTPPAAKSAPTLSTLEQTINRIAAKVGA